VITRLSYRGRDVNSGIHDFVSVDGARLEYSWHGPSPVHAPTMVFLHEGLGSISQWRSFPAELCSRLGCGGLVYNRCGHGKSDTLTAPRTTRFMHHEAMTVLPRLVDMFEIRRPIIVGHSDGASIALIYAGSGAGDPYALILEAPHVFVEDVTVSRIAELRDLYRTTDLRTRLARHHGGNVDALFQYWTDVWLRPAFRTWNIEPYLPDVTCPTLIIQGKQDEYGTDRQVNTLLATLGGRCESIMLERCGHSPHLDQRATVEDIIVRFVRGLE
jgi:pimeloyl-ACP methyl ester carboxylesterase